MFNTHSRVMFTSVVGQMFNACNGMGVYFQKYPEVISMRTDQWSHWGILSKRIDQHAVSFDPTCSGLIMFFLILSA